MVSILLVKEKGMVKYICYFCAILVSVSDIVVPVPHRLRYQTSLFLQQLKILKLKTAPS